MRLQPIRLLGRNIRHLKRGLLFDWVEMASPKMEWQKTHGHERKLTGAKDDQPRESAFHETVGMQADAEHVDPEPGPARDDVAEDCQHHKTALPDQAAPACVEDDGVPEDDQERAVFLRVPTPEATPRLIGPDTAEDGADEAEKRGEADNAVDHATERAAQSGDPVKE